MNKQIRTKFLINPSFQIKFILYLILIALISLAIFYSANLYFFKTLITKGNELNLPSNHVYFELLAEQQSLMNTIFIISASIFTVIISIFGIFISHRIAGPIHKMTTALNTSNSLNEIKEIHFRKKDFFLELSGAFNHFLSKIK